MNENPWSVLSEFIQDYNPSKFEPSQVRQTLNGLNLPETFIQRLESTLTETLLNCKHRHDKENASTIITLRILANFTNTSTASCWGFFFVERGVKPDGTTALELYLYQDQA